MDDENKPGWEPAEESILAKTIRVGLGISSTLALFGCGGLLFLILVLLLSIYLHSWFTGVPFKLE